MAIQYWEGPGYFQDLCYVFSAYFNAKNNIELDALVQSEEEAETFNQSVQQMFLPIPEELGIFFWRGSNGREFLSWLCESTVANKKTGAEVLDEIIKRLEDYDACAKKVFEFYFPAFAEQQQGFSGIKEISKLIDQSKYDAQIRSDLYSFFVSPDRKIRTLILTLLEKSRILSEYYQEQYAVLISKLQESVSNEAAFLNKVRRYLKIESEDPRKPVYWSISLLNRYVVRMKESEHITHILVGILYEKAISSNKKEEITLDLKALGDVFSEPNRILILDFIKGREEVTAKDLEKNLNFSGSTAYYHVTMMQRAGMIKSRVRGKNVLYSVNPEYFDAVVKVFSKYKKGNK